MVTRREPAASYSTSMTPSAPSMAASNFACSTVCNGFTINTCNKPVRAPSSVILISLLFLSKFERSSYYILQRRQRVTDRSTSTNA
jgi:hypothetical protein